MVARRLGEGWDPPKHGGFLGYDTVTVAHVILKSSKPMKCTTPRDVQIMEM
jgi:hypothetical protein